VLKPVAICSINDAGNVFFVNDIERNIGNCFFLFQLAFIKNNGFDSFICQAIFLIYLVKKLGGSILLK